MDRQPFGGVAHRVPIGHREERDPGSEDQERRRGHRGSACEIVDHGTANRTGPSPSYDTRTTVCPGPRSSGPASPAIGTGGSARRNLSGAPETLYTAEGGRSEE